MASPLATAKQSVTLPSSGAKVSRIRRDPPPPVQALEVRDPEQRDARTVVIGILTVTLVLVLIVIGIGNAVGWSPREYTAHL